MVELEPSVKSEHGGGVGLVLPPGFRFHPTDEEVITSYLLHKFLNPSFAPHAIGEVDLNKCEPWDLPSKAKMGENSKEWYFFCHKDMKYPTGTRANRATKEGYWKATGKDREIFKPAAGRDRDRELVGMRKTLVFYMGRAPRGTKTNWVMHEFRLEGKSRHTCNDLRFNPKDEWVVCKVHHKGAEEASAAKKAAGGGGEEQYYSTATPNVSSVEGGDEFLVDSLLDYSSYFNCFAPGGLPLPSTTANSAAAPATNDDDSSWSMLRHAPADQQAMVGSYSLHHQAMEAKAVGGVTSPSFSAGLPSSPVADYVGNDASGYHTNNY